MNPSKEADHLKGKHERSKTKGNGVRDVLLCLEQVAISDWKTSFWSCEGRHAHNGRHAHLVHISHVNR